MNRQHYSEEYANCPYNPAHQCLRHKMQMHIFHCRKNYTGVPMTSCLFNSTHIVRKVDLSEHMSTCPDRRHIDNYLHRTADAPEYVTNLQNDPVTEGELWEDDDVPLYNPESYCASNQILCRLDAEAKSKRKQHRNAERQRFSELDTKRPKQMNRSQQRQPHTSLAQFRLGSERSQFVSQNKHK